MFSGPLLQKGGTVTHVFFWVCLVISIIFFLTIGILLSVALENMLPNRTYQIVSIFLTFILLSNLTAKTIIHLTEKMY